MTPSECMYVGDTKTDMETGNAAKMHTVGVLWGFRDRRELESNGAEVIAEKPQDLLKIVRNGKMIKLVASDLDGTLLMKGGAGPSRGYFSADQTVKRVRDTFCSCKWTPVCQHEKNVCSGSR